MRRFYALLAATFLVAACAAPPPTTPSTTPVPVQPTDQSPLTPATAPASPTDVQPAAAPTPVASGYPLAVQDDRGRTLSIGSSPQRIVTLVPSHTEMLYALGLGDLHVAGTDFDDYPEAALKKPKLGGMRISPEAVISHRPDLVLASSGNPDSLIEQLEAAGVTVLFLDPNDLDGVYESLLLLGEVTGAQTAAADLVANLQQQVTSLTSRTSTVATRPRVYHELDASDPARLFTAGAGTFIDELITLAGGENIAASAPVQWPALSAEELIHADPEVITLGNAAYGMTPEQVAQRPGWSEISAVKNQRVYPMDPDIVSRPGPRIVDGLHAFAKLLHPEVVD